VYGICTRVAQIPGIDTKGVSFQRDQSERPKGGDDTKTNIEIQSEQEFTYHGRVGAFRPGVNSGDDGILGLASAGHVGRNQAARAILRAEIVIVPFNAGGPMVGQSIFRAEVR